VSAEVEGRGDAQKVVGEPGASSPREWWNRRTRACHALELLPPNCTSPTNIFRLNPDCRWGGIWWFKR
jgi:hypothetical protein